MSPDRLDAIRADFERWFAAEWPNAPRPAWQPEHRRYTRTNHNLMMLGWEGAHGVYCDAPATEPGG